MPTVRNNLSCFKELNFHKERKQVLFPRVEFIREKVLFQRVEFRRKYCVSKNLTQITQKNSNNSK